jgi:hypothetical protein
MKFVDDFIEKMHEKKFDDEWKDRIIPVCREGSYDQALKAAEEAIREKNTLYVQIIKTNSRVSTVKFVERPEYCPCCGNRYPYLDKAKTD